MPRKGVAGNGGLDGTPGQQAEQTTAKAVAPVDTSGVITGGITGLPGPTRSHWLETSSLVVDRLSSTDRVGIQSLGPTGWLESADGQWA